MKRLSLDEMLEHVKKAVSYSPYSHKEHSWFFPGDIVAHSASFKYQCKKLYAAGLLERRGTSSDRWGYLYRVPEKSVMPLEVR